MQMAHFYGLSHKIEHTLSIVQFDLQTTKMQQYQHVRLHNEDDQVSAEWPKDLQKNRISS